MEQNLTKQDIQDIVSAIRGLTETIGRIGNHTHGISSSLDAIRQYLETKNKS